MYRKQKKKDACCQTLVIVKNIAGKYFIHVIRKDTILCRPTEVYNLCREEYLCKTLLFPIYFNERGFSMAELEPKKKEVESQTKISLHTETTRFRESVTFKDIILSTQGVIEPTSMRRAREREMESQEEAAVTAPPPMKTQRVAQTDATINPRESREAVRNLAGPSSRKKKQKIPGNPINKYTLIEEIVDHIEEFVLSRSHPRLYAIKAKTADQEVQTVVRYNKVIDQMVMDSDVQTELTCSPRLSTSKLLVKYEERKGFIRSILEHCFVQGVEPRVIIDDLLDEMVAKGADVIKYPVRHQVIQTVASYKPHVQRDEDMLRKLKISVVVDPAETSLIVALVINNILGSTCNIVSQDARCVVKGVLGILVKRAVAIGVKLEAIMTQPQRLTTEEIFLRRRRKIAESMMRKTTETSATQTGFAGVPEVTKLQRKDILCSVCPRESICHLCRRVPSPEGGQLPVKEDTKMLRTQDILLAYNPCYVVATASEEEKNPHLQLTGAMKKRVEKPTVVQIPTSQCTKRLESVKTCVPRQDDTVNVLMTPKKRTQPRDSVSGWTRAINDALTKSWCIKDSAGNASTGSSVNTTSSKSASCCKRTSQPERRVLSSQTIKALRILKNAFCTRDACLEARLVASMDHRPSIKDETDRSDSSCDVENCAVRNPARHRG